MVPKSSLGTCLAKFIYLKELNIVSPFYRFVRRRERARKNNELPARAVPIFPISEKGELELEILYQRMPFPSPTDQQELADRFGVKVKQIITW